MGKKGNRGRFDSADDGEVYDRGDLQKKAAQNRGGLPQRQLPVNEGAMPVAPPIAPQLLAQQVEDKKKGPVFEAGPRTNRINPDADIKGILENKAGEKDVEDFKKRKPKT